MKLIIKKFKATNKESDLPQHRDICIFLENMAKHLYIYLSRADLAHLPKLGIITEYLSKMLSNEIQTYR